MPAAAERRKLRLLCLHGFLQSAETFKSRLGSWRKGLRSHCEFIFLDAPFAAEAPSAAELAAGDDSGDGDPGRTWWRWRDDEPERQRPSRARRYTGWEESQAAIVAALEEHAPIDGLLGFSQGSTAAALFMACTARKSLGAADASPARQLRLAVLAAGFLPMDDEHAAALVAGRPAVPTLFVTGAADELVLTARTRQLWETWAPGTATTLEHPGGHMVPTCSGAVKQSLLRFLEQQQDERHGVWVREQREQERAQER